MSNPDELQDSAYSAEWTRYPERSNATLMRFMIWLSLRLGRRTTRFALAGISLYFILFAPRARVASREYLRRILDRQPTVTELFRHFYYFASTVHDRVFLLNERFDLFQIEQHGQELLERVVGAGRGALLMSAHMGSFEVARGVGWQQSGYKVGMVMYEENARKINATLAAINPAAIRDIVPLGQLDSMLQVKERLDDGMILGILADRTLDDQPTVSVNFIGDTAAFPSGPMRIAAILKRPVLFMTALYLGGNRYAIHFEQLADFSTVERSQRNAAINDAIIAYARCLELQCRIAPYNWFNFFDFWLPKGSA